jgi:hypothetical protein
MSNPFLSEKNSELLQRVLYADIIRRTGEDLTERQAKRLIKTVTHYVKEVARVQGGDKPVQTLNSEVIRVVVPDFLDYMSKEKESAVAVSVSSQQPSFPEDLESRFSVLQQERRPTQQAKPAEPNFRIPLDDSGTPMDAFERLKKEREEEARRAEADAQQKTRTNGSSAGTPIQQDSIAASVGVARRTLPDPGSEFASAADGFQRGARDAERMNEEILAERERKRLEQRASVNLPVPPDMRELVLGSVKQLERRPMVDQLPRQPIANETLALPSVGRSEPTLPQANVIKDDNIVSYVEKENNLFLYSGDRDWTNPLSKETRYDFSINFDANPDPQGNHMTATSQVKFRNISKIEFIKAIMPLEGLQLVTRRVLPAAASTIFNNSSIIALSSIDNSVNTNLLSYPFVQVNIPELNNNNYGTNSKTDNAFAVVQYDAVWTPDSGNSENRGYVGMIPKHMKCQKVYEPTPLATLQKLSVRIQKPDGGVLSANSDVFDIYKVYPSIIAKAQALDTYLGNSFYRDKDSTFTWGTANTLNSAPYYFLQTFAYFDRWAIVPGERIVIKNLTFDTSGFTAAQQAAYVDFIRWITRDEGHIVVQTANDTSGRVLDGVDYLGYANYIIIEGSFTVPPTTTRTLASPPNYTSFGGVADSSSGFAAALTAKTTNSGRLINLSHQVQIALRVITRELDSSTRLRPDNN